MVLWVLNMVGIACAICLAVPDGRPSGAVPAHGAMAPYGSTGGQFPPPGQGAYPVPAQGFGQHPGGGQGFQSPAAAPRWSSARALLGPTSPRSVCAPRARALDSVGPTRGGAVR